MHTIISTTADGSPTLYVPELNEHYHSLHGAMQESDFVFINNALGRITGRYIKVFEVGFGTGLNALLCCLESENKKKEILYHSAEKFPVEKNILDELGNFYNTNAHMWELYKRITGCEWENDVDITDFFTLRKINTDIASYYTSEIYDAIFYDAFSPRAQPEMWTVDIFCKIAGMMKPGAVLSTYSAKGQVRRNIISAGLRAKRVAGPPGKREMIVAIKPGS